MRGEVPKREMELKDEDGMRKKPTPKRSDQHKSKTKGNGSPFHLGGRSGRHNQPFSSPTASVRDFASQNGSRAGSTLDGDGRRNITSSRRNTLPGAYTELDDSSDGDGDGGAGQTKLNGLNLRNYFSPVDRSTTQPANQARSVSGPVPKSSSRSSPTKEEEPRPVAGPSRIRLPRVPLKDLPPPDDIESLPEEDSDDDLVARHTVPKSEGVSNRESKTAPPFTAPPPAKKPPVRSVVRSSSPVKPAPAKDDDDDGIEAITTFTPSPNESKPPSKTNNRPPSAAPNPVRRGVLSKQMQTRDGIVPTQRVTKSPQKWPKGVVPSSGLRTTTITSAHVSRCTAIWDDPTRGLSVPVLFIVVKSDGYVDLQRKPRGDESVTCQFEIKDIVSLVHCSEPGHCFLKLDLHLSRTSAASFKSAFLSSQPSMEPDFNLVLFLRHETGTTSAIEHLVKLVKKPGIGEDVQSVDCGGVAAWQNQCDEYENSRTARHTRTDLSNRTANAAERRVREAPSKTGPSRPRNRKPAAPSADPNQSKLNFSNTPPAEVATRRSTRSTHGPSDRTERVVDYRNYGDEIEIRRSPRPDKNETLFPYPPEGRPDLILTRDAKYRLEDGDFLNDVFIEFGLRYTIAKHKDSDSVHLFNSFFYERLSKKDPKKPKASEEDWPGYDSVKKWTKSADVFKKQFLIVPINESLHWFLAVIYNPAGCLKRGGGVPSPQGSGSAHASSEVDLILEVVKDSDDKDPLDVISDDEDDCIGEVEDRVKDMKIEKSRSPMEQSRPPNELSRSPQPINSFTLDAIQGQWAPPAPQAEVSEALTKAKPSAREDYDIVGSGDKTYIMTFDSLGFPHRAVCNNIKRWLQFEARDKLQREVDLDNILSLDAKVPQQENNSDCGVFLIHYVKTLLENTKDVLNFVGKVPPKTRSEEWTGELETVWQRQETDKAVLRPRWVEILDQYTATYQSLQPQNGAAASGPFHESQGSVLIASQAPAAVHVPLPYGPGAPGPSDTAVNTAHELGTSIQHRSAILSPSLSPSPANSHVDELPDAPVAIPHDPDMRHDFDDEDWEEQQRHERQERDEAEEEADELDDSREVHKLDDSSEKDELDDARDTADEPELTTPRPNKSILSDSDSEHGDDGEEDDEMAEAYHHAKRDVDHVSDSYPEAGPWAVQHISTDRDYPPEDMVQQQDNSSDVDVFGGKKARHPSAPSNDLEHDDDFLPAKTSTPVIQRLSTFLVKDPATSNSHEPPYTPTENRPLIDLSGPQPSRAQQTPVRRRGPDKAPTSSTLPASPELASVLHMGGTDNLESRGATPLTNHREPGSSRPLQPIFDAHPSSVNQRRLQQPHGQARTKTARDKNDYDAGTEADGELDDEEYQPPLPTRPAHTPSDSKRKRVGAPRAKGTTHASMSTTSATKPGTVKKRRLELPSSPTSTRVRRPAAKQADDRLKADVRGDSANPITIESSEEEPEEPSPDEGRHKK